MQLIKAGIANLEISWTPVPTGRFIESIKYKRMKNIYHSIPADSYILQIQRIETPAEQAPPPPPVPVSQTPLAIPVQNPIAPSSSQLQSISASLFATKSPHAGKNHWKSSI